MALLAWYKCQDALASTAVLDASGNSYTAALSGGDNTVTLSVGGPGGIYQRALLLDGATDFVECSGIAALLTALSGLTTFTIEMWVKKVATYSASPGAISIRNATPADATDFVIYPDDTSGGNGLRSRMNGANVMDINTATEVATEWHHVLYSHDGTNARYWRNGILKGTVASTAALTTVGALRIGRLTGGTSYNGAFAGVRIYNTAITTTAAVVSAMQDGITPSAGGLHIGLNMAI